MVDLDPTDKNYSAWRTAYHHFNVALFAGRLRGCLITLQRRRNAYGFHAGSQFEEANGQTKTDEIALNPRHFARRGPREVLSTLVHEMAHEYQCHFGKPGRHGYHNKAWARLMIDIGLVPSSTGKPGGKATGRRVSHFIRDGGPFDLSCTALLNSGFVIPYVEPEFSGEGKGAGQNDRLRAQKAASKTCYACTGCDRPKHVWGKRGLRLICLDCDGPFEADATDLVILPME
jgi:hypothetical protein